MEEHDAAGNVQGTFHLRFVQNDPALKSAEPLTSEVLRGTWASSDGGRNYLVRATLDYAEGHSCTPRYRVAGVKNDTIVERNVQSFYFALLKGNKKEVVKYVSYPCSFFLDGKRSTVSKAANLLSVYDRIFTPKFVSEIAKGNPHHMFANWRGIMIADGAVWFDPDGKAKHFNNKNE